MKHAITFISLMQTLRYSMYIPIPIQRMAKQLLAIPTKYTTIRCQVTNSITVGIRAVPVQGVWIDHNRFQWYVNKGRNEPPVYQSGGSGRMYMTQNLIGPDQVLYPAGPILKL